MNNFKCSLLFVVCNWNSCYSFSLFLAAFKCWIGLFCLFSKSQLTPFRKFQKAVYQRYTQCRNLISFLKGFERILVPLWKDCIRSQLSWYTWATFLQHRWKMYIWVKNWRGVLKNTNLRGTSQKCNLILKGNYKNSVKLADHLGTLTYPTILFLAHCKYHASVPIRNGSEKLTWNFSCWMAHSYNTTVPGVQFSTLCLQRKQELLLVYI